MASSCEIDFQSKKYHFYLAYMFLSIFTLNVSFDFPRPRIILRRDSHFQRLLRQIVISNLAGQQTALILAVRAMSWSRLLCNPGNNVQFARDPASSKEIESNGTAEYTTNAVQFGQLEGKQRQPQFEWSYNCRNRVMGKDYILPL